MEREPIIIGKNLSSEEKEEWRDLLQKERDKSFEPLEGELEKNPEELKFIGKINSWINEEWKKLEIPGKFLVQPEQIHFLSHESFQDKFSNKVNTNGVCDPTTQIIYIDKTTCSRTDLYRTILHEALHLASHYKGKVNNSEEKTLREYRSGYSVFSGTPGENHQYFLAFNEAIIDEVRGEIFRNHLDEFFKEFELTREEQEETFPYNPYQDVVDIIIDKIAKKKSESKEAVYERFKKGLFTGEMMHLRDIERVFGKNAIEILAKGEIDIKKPFDWQIFKKIKEYFSIDDKFERQKIEEEILESKE